MSERCIVSETSQADSLMLDNTAITILSQAVELITVGCIDEVKLCNKIAPKVS